MGPGEKEKLPRQLQESRHCHLRRERGKNPMGWPFLAERPELRDFICERKGKDYVFTPMNEGGFTLSQAMEVKQLHAGATWALDQLVVQSPIGEALKTAFPQRRDYLKVLSIAYFIILNQDNNISKYPTFAEATRLPWGAPLHPSSIGRILGKSKATDRKVLLSSTGRLNRTEERGWRWWQADIGFRLDFHFQLR